MPVNATHEKEQNRALLLRPNYVVLRISSQRIAQFSGYNDQRYVTLHSTTQRTIAYSNWIERTATAHYGAHDKAMYLV